MNQSTVEYAMPSTVSAQRARGRTLTILVILVSFVATTLLQHVSQKQHHTLVKDTGSQSSVSNLTSFSLALLLGGLRGPLVMMLWTSSESQKQEKDLDDFDSKIELIRNLQPEFDSVHLFQMWNKAYNVSVQMANKPNKYTTILDAIEYGRKIDSQRPNDINIIGEIGHIFFDKFGNSQEKEYYTERVLRESFPDEKITVPANLLPALDSVLSKAEVDSSKRQTLVAQANRNGWFVTGKLTADTIRPWLSGPGVTYTVSNPMVFSETGRRVRLDPMLDLDGNLLANLVTGEPRPANLPPDREWCDGSELQYLKAFEPFPYGVPPIGIGWNYYKRCQVIKDATQQKHLQLSELVIDNRPAINMKLWSEAEWGTGRQMEMRAFGLKLPKEDNDSEPRARIELPTAGISPTTPFSDMLAAKEAIYHYDMVVKTAESSMKEFDRHQLHHASVDSSSHRDTLTSMRVLCLADRDYLKAMMLPSEAAAERDSLLRSAIENYNKTMALWEVLMLRHYVSDQVIAAVFPRGVTRNNIDLLPAPQLHGLTFAVSRFLTAHPEADTESDRREVERYYRRAYQRLTQLKAVPPIQ